MSIGLATKLAVLAGMGGVVSGPVRGAPAELYLPPEGLPLGPYYHPGPRRPGKTGVAAAKRAARKRRNQRRARR